MGIININSIFEKISKSQNFNGSKLKKAQIDGAKEAAEKFLECLLRWRPAQGESARDTLALINIIKETCENATVSEPSITNGVLHIDINFNKHLLRRKSLLAESKKTHKTYRTGKGIDNILKLFNTGYKIEKESVLYGRWDTHSSTNNRRKSIYTHARRSREPQKFMQQVSLEFMFKYGTKYGVRKLDISNYE